MGITRRDLLKGVAVGTLVVGCGGTSSGGGDDDGPPDGPNGPGGDGPGTPPEDTPEVAEHFTLGVSAGDLVDDRGVLWTQYAGSASLAAFAWRLDASGHDVEQLGPFAATPGDAGFTHVAVDGLVAGARYRYAFFELDGEARVARSPIGRFRVPIAADATEVLTFGAISCTDKSRPADAIQRAAERADLDAFLLLGDNAYCDGAEVQADYRRDYRDHYGRPAHIALRASTGLYATWDDHEVANDWNPETIDSAQLATAFATFFEHLPIARDPAAPNRIWRSVRWGTTVEIFVLDSRSERKPSTRFGADAQYLSPEQLAWLEAGLAASPCTFKLIMNSVPITNMPNVWDVYRVDRWEGYQAQRTALLSFIDERAITGVLWLSGDFHLAFISHVTPSGPGQNQREVLCGPGSQSANVLSPSLTAPQFSFVTTTNNFTTLRFDPTSRAVTVGYVDGTGTTFHSESFVP
ncbi:MAG TPA: alkaline phosphatase D family protein [Kofleriaceae bacterium]|nr:alkaline phosphatase D family protein [Kofleriaceae bacterium]